jgi:alpha-D-ribose 1-methylphosphonate 5-triphosphate synthase subunit PhnH
LLPLTELASGNDSPDFNFIAASMAECPEASHTLIGVSIADFNQGFTLKMNIMVSEA